MADYLEASGARIVGMNVRVGRLEIDVLATRGDLVIVVEVRTRGDGAWQTGLESIDPAKIQRLKLAGERLWLERFENDSTVNRMRFDVASVTLAKDGSTTIDYAEGAI